MNLIEKEDKIDKTISEFLKSDDERLRKKGIKLKDIKKAQEKGWTGLSLNELDYDIEEIYQKLISVIKNANEITKEELAVIAIINNIKRDKIDLLKFMSNNELKNKELEYKYKSKNDKLKFNEVEL